MMAAVLYGKEHLQVEPVAVPTIDRGDILVRVKVALDLRHRCQGLPSRIPRPDDRAPGCVRARTGRRCRRIGEDVTNFRSGSAWWRPIRRPAESVSSAGGPGESLRGPALQQRRLRPIHPHSGPHRAAQYLPHSRHVGYQDAALVEPLACVVRGFEESAPRAGDTMAIVGLGPSG
jgi:L-iditol 2-dehydrogenase